MLLSFNRPSDIAVSLESTAAWLSDDAGAALVDGAPNVKSRLSWITGTQTTTSETVIKATWATAIVPRVAALIGTTLPEGLKVTIDFYTDALSPAAWGYHSTTGYVITMNNGTTAVWFVLPSGLDSVTGIKFHLVNEVSGATAIDAGDAIDIGELWVGSSDKYQLKRSIQDDLVDPTIRNRTLGQQVYATKRLPYRKLTFDMALVGDAQVDTTRVLRATTAQSVPAVLIIDPDKLESALFGNITSFGLSTGGDGPHWQPSVSFEEMPNG